jgi:hypothetical protein
MPDRVRVGTPGPRGRFRDPDDGLLSPPADWELVPAGDAALTRRIKAAGPHWAMQEARGRKIFSRGIWAPRAQVGAIRDALELERADPAWARRRSADAQRREVKQAAYVEDFRGAVLAFLDFAPRHGELAERLADAVAAHATPVGSGTVARTQRIGVERRAEAALIAWLRHQTTSYDGTYVPRVKGARRALRAELASKSRALLTRYRRGAPVDPRTCPLHAALQSSKDGSLQD